jgi:DnaK suppressor protein
MLDTQKYGEHLEEMLKTVTEELKTVGIHNPQNPSDWIAVPTDFDAEESDANLLADSVENWNERAALVATLEPQYNNIINALKRIKEGTYGICTICETEIEEKRLDANPTAHTCIAHREEA